MTQPITVLIVEDEHDVREPWAQVVSPIARVKCAATIPEALAMMAEADVLLLDWHLCGQQADVVLDRWVTDVGGPVCVLSGELSQAHLYELFARGVYNAFQKPVPLPVIAAVVRHYCNDVRMRQELETLAREVHSLRKWMIALAVIAAGATGPTIVPKLVGLLTGLAL
jgi:DNA-binding NtrC family response regulator